MKRIAITQPCCTPWRGFFDFIRQVDEYIIFDDVQFAKRHWHNRNKIETAQVTDWLTIPVVSKGKFEQTMEETMIAWKLFAIQRLFYRTGLGLILLGFGRVS